MQKLVASAVILELLNTSQTSIQLCCWLRTQWAGRVAGGDSTPLLTLTLELHEPTRCHDFQQLVRGGRLCPLLLLLLCLRLLIEAAALALRDTAN